MNERSRTTPPAPAALAELLVAASRERTVLISGFLAGVCVFVTPMAILGLGLMAAYVASLLGDGDLGPGFQRADFQAVFAPAVNEAPLLVTAGLLGAFLAQFRRWLARRTDRWLLRFGRRPFFPELILLYVLLVGLSLLIAGTRGGGLQLDRLRSAAPVFLLFMVGASWLIHSVWSYCFRNIIDLLANGSEHDAAADLRRAWRSRGKHA
ncbi:MAG TPA: hypothetical protein VHN78_14340 [Chloroflexota bacterium]|nr:hypothetical protein [Chloroflexota bacterium]